MQEVLFDTLLYREFAQLLAFGRVPDESTILRFRDRSENHKPAEKVFATVNFMLEEHGLLLKAGTPLVKGRLTKAA